MDISEDNMVDSSRFLPLVHGTSGFTTGRTLSQGEAVPISAKQGQQKRLSIMENEAINTNVVTYAPSNNPANCSCGCFP